MYKYILFLIFFFLFSSYGNCFVVAIDSGHSFKKWGARSYSGINEYLYNKKIVEKLHLHLYENNISSIIVNDNFLLNERASQASLHANILISIHHDSVFWRDWNKRHLIKGYSIFVSHKNKYYQESKILADKISTEFIEEKFQPNLYYTNKKEVISKEKGIYNYPNLIILKTAKMPSVLLECGVIVNKNEDKILKEDDTQNRMVRSIYNGIVSYIMEKYKYI